MSRTIPKSYFIDVLVHPGCSDHPVSWRRMWESCVAQIRRWRIPPRWNDVDWVAELQSEGAAAALEAIACFEPSRNVPLHAYVRMRVMGRVLTRYRQEWTYAIRQVPEEVSDASELSSLASPSWPVDELRDVLTQLDDPDRALIIRIFWNAETEAEIARSLGLSQQAISRRKKKILDKIRERMEHK
jgi:RNA polymerase sigma factor (sigma-70 family)